MDREELGRRIRRLREWRGLSRRALGDFVIKTERWVYDLEHGKAPLDVVLAYGLAAGFRVQVEVVLGLAPLPQGSGVLDEDDDVRRREFLGAMGVFLLAGLDPVNPAFSGSATRLSRTEVADLGELTRHYGLMYWQMSPRSMAALLDEHGRRLAAGLGVAATGQQRELLMLASATSRLAGLAAYDQGDQGAALQRFEVAEHLALEAGEATALTLARISRRLVTSEVDAGGEADRVTSAAAIAVLDAAEHAADSSVPGSVRAWLHCSRAEEYSALGQADRAFADLDRAGAVLTTGPRVEGPQVDTEHWNETRLDGWRASVLLRLGDYRAAADILELVVPATPVGMSGYRAATESNLGAAYALSGEVEQAVALQFGALERARADRRQDGMDRVRRHRDRYLAAYADLPVVRQLDQALLG